MTKFRFLLVIISTLMMCISLYLTHHYYSIFFPSDLSISSFCDISSFFNCDSAALSPLGSFFNIPTSFFGFIFGFLVFISAIFYKEYLLKTNFNLSVFNLCGCVGLFLYSVTFLKGLCPGCLVYYVLSFLLVILFYLKERKFNVYFDFKVLTSYFIFSVCLILSLFLYGDSKFKRLEKDVNEYISKVKQRESYDETCFLEDDYFLVKSTQNFLDAPIRVILFSDFECPYCTVLSKELEKIKNRFSNKINIRYVFFPLEGIHENAKDAALFSMCAESNFLDAYNLLINNQNKISQNWLKDQAKQLNIEQCYEDKIYLDKLNSIITKSKEYNLNAAPTMIINGKKIAGLLPTFVLIKLFESFL